MKLEKKQEIVKDLHERFLKSNIVIVTDYEGLDVGTMSDLRRKLWTDKAEYQVVKNTLLVRASEGTDVAAIQPYFKGPTAIALSDYDPVSTAKILTKFAKEHNKLELKGAFLKSGKKGRVLDAKDIKTLSELPSREILLGQLLSVMNAVPTGLVRALSDVPRRMMNVLQAIKEKKEKTSEVSET